MHERLRAEAVLSMCAAAVGVISVASALTPELRSRIDLVDGVLPPGVASGARILALAFGLALIWLSAALARRRRRAWRLAVALVAGTAVAHLVKGLDAEEATASVLLLAALVRYRGRFDVAGDPTTGRPLVAATCGLAALGGFLGLYWFHRLALPEEVEDLAIALAGLLGVWSLYLWLRPWHERVRQTRADREAARTVVRAAGEDSLAYFALRRDKSYFFSRSRRSLLAYRVVAGSALISGDPIGDESEFAELLEEFRSLARLRAWRVAVLGASERHLGLYAEAGLRAIKIGDEAVLLPGAFSLEGRQVRKVRQSVHRLRRAGYRVRIVRDSELGPSLRQELQAISDAWRRRAPERGFVMAMDELFGDLGRGSVYCVAEDRAGRVGGFLHLVPCPASGNYSMSAMRRSRSTPNGLMEFLIAETLAWARAQGAVEVSLTFCVFADVLRNGAPHALRFALRRLDRLFQLERLLRFSGKFLPAWRPRYLCFERLSDFPLVGLAWLWAEALIVPPLPLRRRLG